MQEQLALSKVLLKSFYKKSLYFRMPKVASESITRGLTNKTAVIPHSLCPNSVRTIFKCVPFAYKFTVVRDPIKRFVSAYLWASRENIDTSHYQLDILQKKEIEECGDINQFIEVLPNLLKDQQTKMIHFYPQTNYLFHGNTCLVDFIGKIESFESTLSQLRKCVQFNDSFDLFQKFKGGGGLKNVELSTKSIKLLGDIYRKDFALLGYERP